MKKSIVFLSCIMLLFSLTGTLGATVLSFDDIGEIDYYSTIPNGYGGFEWNNMDYLNSSSDGYQGTGYEYGTVSGDYVAFNAFGNVAAVSDSEFDFNGAWFTAAWKNNLNLQLTGSLSGTQIYQETIVLNWNKPIWFSANFMNIDQLHFYSYGGTDAGLGQQEPGSQFVMDNFTFNEPASVPEPSTMLLFGACLLPLIVSRKRFGKR